MTTLAAAPTNRVRRYLSGAFATLLAQLVNLLGQFLLVPLFLAAWGTELYGEWLTLYAAVAYLALLDLGLQNHVVNKLTEASCRGENDEYAEILHTSLASTLVLSVAAILGAAAAAAWLPIGAWLDFRITDPDAARLVIVLLVVQVVAAVPAGLIGGIYRTVGEYPRGMMIANAQRVLHFALSAVVLWRGGTLAALALAQLLPIAGGVAYVLLDLRRRHPDVPLGVARARLGLAGALIGPSALFLAIQLAMVFGVQGATLLVSAMFGAAAVTVFITLRTLANLIRQVAGGLANALWPEATILSARGERATLREVHLFAAKLLLGISLIAAAVLHHTGGGVVHIWTRGAVRYDPALMTFLLVALVSQAAWLISSIVLLSQSRRHRVVAEAYLVASALGLLLGALLARRFGLAGVAAGLAAADVLYAAWRVPAAACRVLEQPFGAFLRQVLVKGALFGAALLGLAAWLPAPREAVADPGAFTAQAAAFSVAIGAAGIALIYGFWLTPAERGRLHRVVGRLRRRPVPPVVPGGAD